MPKSNAHLMIASKRNQMLALLHNTKTRIESADSSEESEDEDQDCTRVSDPPQITKTTSQLCLSKRALPLKCDGNIIEMKFEDTVLSHRSIYILHQFPTFKGIKLRVPEYFVIDAETGSEIALTSQLKAITMLIRSYMATQIRDVNIKLKV